MAFSVLDEGPPKSLLLAYANNGVCMVRPIKCRLVAAEPNIDYFKPRGIPLIELEEVVLQLDEFEALRLADLEGLYQEEACQQMQVSRATFGNILTGARQKVSDAIINGKAIRIEGGVYNMRLRNRARRCFRHGSNDPEAAKIGKTVTESNPGMKSNGEMTPGKPMSMGQGKRQRCRRRGR